MKIIWVMSWVNYKEVTIPNPITGVILVIYYFYYILAEECIYFARIQMNYYFIQ